jgi:hypothetical protein
MLRIKTVMGALITATILLLASGCYKDMTVVSETGDEITRTVSFSSDIIPIFNSDCNGSGCHSSGGKAPDLSAANAYNALGNYINTSDPAKSELYLWMTGKKGIPMPVSGINKDYNALILAWIKQGGNNN